MWRRFMLVSDASVGCSRAGRCKPFTRNLSGADAAARGSRATGRARPFSDLDLLLLEPPRLIWTQSAALSDAFEASDLPFCVDVLEAEGLAEGMAQRVRGEATDLP